MRSLLNIFLAAMLFVLVAGAATAVATPSLTTISGHIYEADGTTPVANASVKVTCNGNVKNTMSSATGSYGVVYTAVQCPIGSDVTVEASKDSASGSNDGKVEYNGKCLVNTEVVDVSIPEFGVVAGAVALVGALGIFIYRRHK